MCPVGGPSTDSVPLPVRVKWHEEVLDVVVPRVAVEVVVCWLLCTKVGCQHYSLRDQAAEARAILLRWCGVPVSVVGLASGNLAVSSVVAPSPGGVGGDNGTEMWQVDCQKRRWFLELCFEGTLVDVNQLHSFAVEQPLHLW